MTITGVEVPAIPDILITDPNIRNILLTLKQIAEIREGRRGDVNQRFITYYELISYLSGADKITVEAVTGGHNHDTLYSILSHTHADKDLISAKQINAKDVDGLKLFNAAGLLGITVRDNGKLNIDKGISVGPADADTVSSSIGFAQGRAAFGWDGADGRVLVQSSTGRAIKLIVNGTTLAVLFHSSGNVGFGTEVPDKVVEINKSDGGELRLTYNESGGGATDYCDLKVGSDGDLTITTVDSDGAAGDINLLPDGKVAIDADLVFKGESNGLGYGSLYAHDAAINLDIIGVGQGVPVKITGLTTGLINNVTINSDAFNVDNIGVYKVDWQISGDSAGTGKVYDCHIHINGVAQDDGSSHRGFGAIGSLGSFSGTAILDITDTGHDIDLRISEPGAGGGTDIHIDDVNFNVVQIGGT